MNLLSHIKKQKSLKVISADGQVFDLLLLNKIILQNELVLNALNIKKTDVIAIVLENGIEYVTTFLSIINKSISAPLNPNYSIGEYNFYYKNYARKTSVYESSLVSNNNNYYTKMKLKYEYIDNHLIKDFVEYVLFCLKNI